MLNFSKKIKKRIYMLLSLNRDVFKFYLSYIDRNRSTWRGESMIYNLDDLNREYYKNIKKTNDRELEHQIGRLINYKKIAKKSKKLQGDVIEFGTWKGFSLLWISYFLERNAIFNKKIVGLDGFAGLPYSDGVFLKNAFTDSSYEECKKNLKGSKFLYSKTRDNILIGKFLFKEKKNIENFLKNNKIAKFSFIHIDCDVSKSLIEIMHILNSNKLIADKAYILFDDYGCESDLGKTVDKIFEKMKKEWKIKVDSSTILTKNFYLERR